MNEILIQFWPDAKIFVTIVHFIYDKKFDLKLGTRRSVKAE